VDVARLLTTQQVARAAQFSSNEIQG
jgi:hypothetical protein